ncbi:hypothetical protein [Burkholderia gladioli]
MKASTLQTLITARALLEQAERHCELGDRYLATAGLIVLQDAVELAFLALLIEKQVDEDRAIENLTFDEMIAQLGKIGLKVPKSGTLRAMNKLRVTAKHYGQVMEPITVQGHLNAARVALDSVLFSAVGKTFREIFLVEIVGEIASRPYLDAAASALANKNYIQSLIETRKAFFIEFEDNYCIYPYRNYNQNPPFTGLLGLAILSSGHKAPAWTKNSTWISANIKDPFNYIQINHETWRIDAIEWGINTQILNNIQRLTPDAVRLEAFGEWHIRYSPQYITNNANHDNAAKCLDLTIEAIRRKHEYIRSALVARNDKPGETPSAYIGQPLYEKSSQTSKVIRYLADGDTYYVRAILNGFNPNETFYSIDCTSKSGETASGYVMQIKAQSLENRVSDLSFLDAGDTGFASKDLG